VVLEVRKNPDDLPITIEVLNRKTLEEKQIRDIRDASRELPNVSVQRAPARFTAAGRAQVATAMRASISVAWRAIAC
jgi:outer membrane receptor for ferrienterochelin and colicin